MPLVFLFCFLILAVICWSSTFLGRRTWLAGTWSHVYDFGQGPGGLRTLVEILGQAAILFPKGKVARVDGQTNNSSLWHIYFLEYPSALDITLPTKVRLVKAMVFPVVMYGCESWTIKKAEHQRIDAFELWCWRRLLRIPWTARRSNQSILKEISPGCSLEGLMLKLKLQYFGHLIWRTDSLEKPWC